MKLIGLLVVGLIAILAFHPSFASAGSPLISRIDAVDTVAIAYPANGDLGAHGIALIPNNSGVLQKGDMLVSNFKNSDALFGKGSTIVEISPAGDVRLFAQINASTLPGTCPGGVGLTGLVVLKTGWVIAGSLPTLDGRLATARAGCLIVLNNQGHVVETISGDPINGPWDMTVVDGDYLATVFVTNVLNGMTATNQNEVVNKGNVVRIGFAVTQTSMPKVITRTVVASGFGERPDPKMLVSGPSGEGYDGGTLYVADPLGNRIAAIPNALFRLTSAGTGNTLSTAGAINQPLGLALTRSGNILISNGGNGEMVEVTKYGSQIAVKNVDPPGLDDDNLTGLVVTGQGVYFLYDGDDGLNLLH